MHRERLTHTHREKQRGSEGGREQYKQRRRERSSKWGKGRGERKSEIERG